MWDHMTHAESRLRLGSSPFKGYAVKGISFCDHDSTHMDAIYHFNCDRPDLTVDTFAIENSFMEAAWIDLSDAAPRTSISLDQVKRAMEQAKIERLPEGGALLYFTGAAKNWEKALEFVHNYPGLDEKASRWILDQGVLNVLTDAVSTDNPADLGYPNHRMHAEYLVNHTEAVNNIDRIPRHSGFSIMLIPLVLSAALAPRSEYWRCGRPDSDQPDGSWSIKLLGPARLLRGCLAAVGETYLQQCHRRCQLSLNTDARA